VLLVLLVLSPVAVVILSIVNVLPSVSNFCSADVELDDWDCGCCCPVDVKLDSTCCWAINIWAPLLDKDAPDEMTRPIANIAKKDAYILELPPFLMGPVYEDVIFKFIITKTFL